MVAKRLSLLSQSFLLTLSFFALAGCSGGKFNVAAVIDLPSTPIVGITCVSPAVANSSGTACSCDSPNLMIDGICQARRNCFSPAVLNRTTNVCDCNAPNLSIGGICQPPDIVAPIISFTSGGVPSAVTTQTSAAFAITASERIAYSKVWLDTQLINGSLLGLSFTQSVGVGSHTVQVQAFDYSGNGSVIISHTWLVNPLVVIPSAPTVVTAIAGNEQATVDFSGPSSNGGAEITSYLVTSSGGQTAVGSASPITVSGLTNGTAYTFTVRATNSAGTGPASVSTPSVTPAKINSTTFGLGNAISISIYGDNAVSFGSHYSLENKFIGRVMNDKTGSTWSLVLSQMDWTSKTMSFVKDILDTKAGLSIENGARTLTTAYDATVTQWNGELWVAFECYGANFSGSAATCIGPLKTDFTVDISRINVVVEGVSYNSMDLFYYSASVPKLVTHKGLVYLYWSVVKINKTSGEWMTITTRGTELVQESIAPKRFWAKGSGGTALAANDPSSVEVYGLGTDNTTNRVADLFGVVSDGESLYATGALGGGACLNPLYFTKDNGCYRLAISQSKDPLGYRAFNNFIVSPELLPPNPQAYARFIYRPDDGKTLIMGHFYNLSDLGITPHNLTAYVWPDLIIKPVCDPKAKSWPDWGEKNGKCLGSCGVIGGLAAYSVACDNYGMSSAGDAYDVVFCCK